MENKNKIEKWLSDMDIQRYSFNEKGEIDVAQEVILNDKGLTELPYKFGHVKGGFECKRNRLTSLKNSPHTVDEYFSCSNNQITSLEEGPQKVEYSYYCDHNRLSSLKGLPHEIASLVINKNHFKSMEGLPSVLNGNLVIDKAILPLMYSVRDTLKDISNNNINSYIIMMSQGKKLTDLLHYYNEKDELKISVNNFNTYLFHLHMEKTLNVSQNNSIKKLKI